MKCYPEDAPIDIRLDMSECKVQTILDRAFAYQLFVSINDSLFFVDRVRVCVKCDDFLGYNLRPFGYSKVITSTNKYLGIREMVARIGNVAMTGNSDCPMTTMPLLPVWALPFLAVPGYNTSSQRTGA